MLIIEFFSEAVPEELARARKICGFFGPGPWTLKQRQKELPQTWAAALKSLATSWGRSEFGGCWPKFPLAELPTITTWRCVKTITVKFNSDRCLVSKRLRRLKNVVVCLTLARTCGFDNRRLFAHPRSGLSEPASVRQNSSLDSLAPNSVRAVLQWSKDWF